MTDLIVVPQPTHWQRLKALVLDSVSSPITKRVYNLGLDEFFAWFGQEPRAGFTKATVAAWRVALEARGLGAVSINVRITAVRKLAVEAADNGLLAPELASGITRVKGGLLLKRRVLNRISIPRLPRPIAISCSILQAADARLSEGLTSAGLSRMEPRPLRIEECERVRLTGCRVRSAEIRVAIRLELWFQIVGELS
jgi:site-specific recombinase XerC